MKYLVGSLLMILMLSLQPAFAMSRQDSRRTTIEDKLNQAMDELQYLSSLYEKNKIIESCYFNNKKNLRLRHVNILLDNLRYTESDYNDSINTQNRIASDFFKINKNRFDVATALKVIKKQDNLYTQNAMIETYFKANKDKLLWKDVKQLLYNLWNTESDYNDSTNTQDRIVREWRACSKSCSL